MSHKISIISLKRKPPPEEEEELTPFEGLVTSLTPKKQKSEGGTLQHTIGLLFVEWINGFPESELLRKLFESNDISKIREELDIGLVESLSLAPLILRYSTDNEASLCLFNRFVDNYVQLIYFDDEEEKTNFVEGIKGGYPIETILDTVLVKLDFLNPSEKLLAVKVRDYLSKKRLPNEEDQEEEEKKFITVKKEEEEDVTTTD